MWFNSLAKRIQNKAVVNETRSVEELGALLAKAESAFDMQQARHGPSLEYFVVWFVETLPGFVCELGNERLESLGQCGGQQ